MSINELITIIDELSHTDKADLHRHLVHELGLDESVKTIRSYALNGSGPHTAREERILESLLWIDDVEPIDPEEEAQNRIIEQESEAYGQMHSELLAKYPGQHVAIHQGKLVDRDGDQMLLYHRVRNKYGNIPVLMRQVRQEAVHTMQMPSSMMRLSYN